MQICPLNEIKEITTEPQRYRGTEDTPPLRLLRGYPSQEALVPRRKIKNIPGKLALNLKI
jgi:hypothetical protein